MWRRGSGYVWRRVVLFHRKRALLKGIAGECAGAGEWQHVERRGVNARDGSTKETRETNGSRERVVRG